MKAFLNTLVPSFAAAQCPGRPGEGANAASVAVAGRDLLTSRLRRMLAMLRPMRPRRVPTRPGYLPGLDGLRALAVIAVVIFHLAPGLLPGGFIGVEVFFVISGYIITRALLAEHDRSGRIALARFWLRRARRLLPALFLLLAAVAGYCSLFSRSDLAGLRGDILAALTYVTNWDLILTGATYFDSWERPSLLRHLWSLAVEEQFYLLWPLIIAAALAALGRRLSLSLITAAVTASAFAMAMLHEPGGSVTRVYYGTDTRASGLLIGAALAFVWSAGPVAVGARQLAPTLLGVGGSAALVGFALLSGGSSEFLYEGGFTLAALATAALIVAATCERSPFARRLGTPLLCWVGIRSYGIYLWHWPVIMLTRPGVDVPVDGTALAALRLALTLILAEGSYRWVEAPFRRHGFGPLRRRLQAWGSMPVRQQVALAVAIALVATATGAVTASLATARPPQRPAYFSQMRIQLVNTSSETHAEVSEEETPASAVASTFSWVPANEGPPSLSLSVSSTLPQALPGTPQDDLTACISTGAEDTPGDAIALPSLAVSEDALAALALMLEADFQVPRLQTQATRTEEDAGEPASSPLAAENLVRVTAVGDSVMMGAAHQLSESVPSLWLDASVGRSVATAIRVLEEQRDCGGLGEIVLLHVGNNGRFTDAHFDRIMKVTGPGRRVVFLTVRVPRPWQAGNNASIRRGVKRYSQAKLVDWRSAIEKRAELLWTDGTHLKPEGAKYYAEIVAPHLVS